MADIINNKSGLMPLLLFVIGIASRLPLIEKYQSHWDGPDYSIAILSYSLENHTPTAPGYPLYIVLGKLINLFLNNPHLSLLMISVLVTGLTASLIYIGTKRIFNYKVGIIASLIYLSGSTFYFFGLTPYAYILLPLMTFSLGFMVYRIFIKKEQLGLLLGIITGIYFGIRPQEMLQVAPLVLLGFLFLKLRQKMLFLTSSLIITILWFIPLVNDTGGLSKYLEINSNAAGIGVFTYTISHNIELIVKGFLLSFGISSLFLLYYPFKFLKDGTIINKHKKLIIFFSVFLIPSFLFNLFVRTDHAGYQMSYLTGFLLIISYAVWRITKKSKNMYFFILSILVAFNLFWFFYDRDSKIEKPFRPTSFHYTDIRKNDLKTGSKVDYVSKNFNPKTTLLIGTDVLWRPYTYHLKPYKFIAINALYHRTPPNSHIRYESQNWDYKQIYSENYSIKIPENISTIILMDDKAHRWTPNEYEIIKLSGNSDITVLNVNSFDEINYGHEHLELN
jgi:hypothetical protein